MKRVFFLKINDRKTQAQESLFNSIKKYVERKCAGTYIKKIEADFGHVDCDILTDKLTCRVVVTVDDTAYKLLTALKALHGRQDFETSHEEADNLLYDFLIEIGYKEVADAYEKVGKWYS